MTRLYLRKMITVSLAALVLVLVFVTGYALGWYKQAHSYAVVSHTTKLVETKAYLMAVESIDTKGPEKARSFLLSLGASNLETIGIGKEQQEHFRWWQVPNTIVADYTNTKVLNDTEKYNQELEHSLKPKLEQLKNR
ncbi:MAG TPA: hypothetical protein VJS64_00025 [Pyrinomonadaceae bacterium]|nr:hypothetical protein [Pyrinomonadaceae bacterium]